MPIFLKHRVVMHPGSNRLKFVAVIPQEPQSFRVGDAACWTSEANGTSKTKTGVIQEIIPAGRLPSEHLYPELYRGAKIGRARDHVSYVVKVGKRAYWPRARFLLKADVKP
jgi:hypothetical protein